MWWLSCSNIDHEVQDLIPWLAQQPLNCWTVYVQNILSISWVWKLMLFHRFSLEILLSYLKPTIPSTHQWCLHKVVWRVSLLHLPWKNIEEEKLVSYTGILRSILLRLPERYAFNTNGSATSIISCLYKTRVKSDGKVRDEEKISLISEMCEQLWQNCVYFNNVALNVYCRVIKRAFKNWFFSIKADATYPRVC